MESLGDLSKISDKDLLALCQEYGTKAIAWRRKFIGLLPEVNRRELFLKKGFSDIYEFGARMAGLSREQVQRAIQIEKKFESRGLEELKKVFVEGEASINKMARIASIASKENEGILVDAVKKLSQSAVETLVRDERHLNGGDVNENSVRAHSFDFEKSQGQANLRLDFQLSDKIIHRLNELNAQGRDANKILGEMLDKREEEIAEEVEKVSEEIVEKEEMKKENGGEVWRHVPAGVRRVIERRSGSKCEVKGCQKPAKHLHHTIRFGIQKSHDPRYMVQLCAEHHQITHVMDGAYMERRKR